ncbi:MAG: relaxase/mobilization nuclease domain-containing protein [Coleofasciculus sp. S288]|nr:relaxase/mobilization nuclease domain-containing protein [Coleofasciculus sp. S288]
MIGKVTKGEDFDGILRYITSKPGAEYIGGNMLRTTRAELVQEFNAVARASHRVRLPVAHFSLSPHPSEKLDNETALSFAQEYLNRIGFEECQWVLYRHNDTKTPDNLERPHFHIVANRVRMTDGKAVSSWQDWRRSERALRELEREFALIQVQPSWETDRRAPSTGQQRRIKREKEKYEAGIRPNPPEQSIKAQLQEIIDRVTADKPTLAVVISRLQKAGVEVKTGFTRTGKPKGISYELQGVAFAGNQLGKAYSFTGLQQHRGVQYNKSDNPLIEELVTQFAGSTTRRTETPPKSDSDSIIGQEGEATSTSVSTIQQERTQFVARVLRDLLARSKASKLEGKNYKGEWSNGQLSLFSSQDSSEIMRAKPQDDGWEAIASVLTEQHLRDFQLIEQELLKSKTKPKSTQRHERSLELD